MKKNKIPQEIKKTPQQIKNEVEKGCGNDFVKKLPFGTTEEVWGEKEYLLTCPDEKYGICPFCQAKLSILTEYDKAIENKLIEHGKDWYAIGVTDTTLKFKEMIEDLQKKVRRMLIDNSKCDCTKWTTRYGDISDVCFWEFLSKIGARKGLCKWCGKRKEMHSLSGYCSDGLITKRYEEVGGKDVRTFT
jgi:hypothetical protein